MTHVIVEGTSEPQLFQITDDGDPYVGTGITLGIEAREDITGVAVAWANAAIGTVSVTGIEDLALGRYHVRFTLTDSGGKIGYSPNLSLPSDEWIVTRV